MQQQLINIITTAISFGTVILFGALGEILTEKSGHLNLGVPGIMYIGGICGLVGAFFYENYAAAPIGFVGLIISFFSCLIGAALAGLIYSVLTVTLRANQNVTGLTITIFGTGLGNFLGGRLNSLAGGVGQIRCAITSRAYRASLPIFDKMGFLGDILRYGWMVYFGVLVAVALWFFLNKTSAGLNLRSVGENPATADADGINITKYKYLATIVGAAISGLGGIYYVMDYINGTWANDGNIEAVGWLAVALVIFATWKPLRAIWGAYLFGGLFWLWNKVPSFIELMNSWGWNVPTMSRSGQEIFKMLPYIVTLIVLVRVSLRHKKEDMPPASLGLPYFREER